MERRTAYTLGSVLLLVSACSSGGGGSTAIQIGALLAQTGDCNPYGVPEWNSVQMAADEINDAGGVLGRPILPVLKDSQSTPDGSIAGAQALAALGAGAIVGCACSSETIAAAINVTVPGKIALVAPSSSAAAYSDLHVDGGFTFRLVNSDNLQAAVLTEVAEDAGIKIMGILYDQSQIYSTGLASGIQADFGDAGGTITTSVAYAPGQTDYTSALQQVFDAGAPQAVAVFGYLPDVPTLLGNYVSGFKSNNLLWLGSDTLPTPVFVSELGTNAGAFDIEGAGDVVPAGTLYNTYLSNYTARFGANAASNDLYGANAYDSFYMIALAIQQSGKTDGQSIANGLMAIGSGSGTSIDPTQFGTGVSDLKAGQAIKYTGVTGPCTFNGFGDVVDPYFLWTVQSGSSSPVTLIPSLTP